jgi:hypothetical protein
VPRIRFSPAPVPSARQAQAAGCGGGVGLPEHPQMNIRVQTSYALFPTYKQEISKGNILKLLEAKPKGVSASHVHFLFISL